MLAYNDKRSINLTPMQGLSGERRRDPWNDTGVASLALD